MKEERLFITAKVARIIIESIFSCIIGLNYGRVPTKEDHIGLSGIQVKMNYRGNEYIIQRGPIYRKEDPDVQNN